MRESALFVAASLAVSIQQLPRLCIGVRFTRERRACTRAGRMATATVPNCQMMIVMETNKVPLTTCTNGR
jgi:hypothetical protein